MARTKRGSGAVPGGNNGKNIERRREGDEWFYRFKVDGQPYYGPCNTTDKRKAEAFAKELKAKKKVEASNDRDAGVGPMTFGRACDVWWNEEGSSNVETGLKFRLDWLKSRIGEKRLLKDLTPEDITGIKVARGKCVRTAGKNAKGEQLYRALTPAAVKATLVTLRTVINYAGKAKGASVRMFDWPFWIKQDDEEHDVRIMSETEQELIWPELSDEVRELAEFNLETPKRIMEILPLTWPNVDLRGETIRIKLKGKSKLFNDPVGPAEVARLQRLKAAKHDPVAVFTYVSGVTREYNGEKHVAGQRRPMTYDHFYQQWTAACAKVGIAGLNPHCIRHTGATRYYWASGDINAVSRMLNHSDISTTYKYYVRNDPTVVRDLKRRVAQGLLKNVTAKVTALLKVV